MMTKTVRHVLASAGDWVPAQQLFERCALPSDAGGQSVEDFYEQLRELNREGALEVMPLRDAGGLKLEDHLRLKVV